MSKKSKYLWKKIMILTWMFSLFLGILAGPCAIDAKNQKEKKDYGVFLSIDSSQIKKLYGYRLVVIDAQYFSAKDIRTLHKKGVKVYTYLNVGSIENFRDYYKKYEYLTIGTYENWEDVFNMMHQRGLYPTPDADANKVENAKQKFSQCVKTV